MRIKPPYPSELKHLILTSTKRSYSWSPGSHGKNGGVHTILKGLGAKGIIKVALIILCHHSVSLCLFGNVPQHIIAPVNDSKQSWKWQVFPNTKESNAGSRGFTLQGMHLEEKRSKPQQLNWHSEVIVHPKQGNFKAFLQKREKNY